MVNKKQTSSDIASLAGKTLANPNASDTAKKLAASALSQADKAKETGAGMEGLASKVLQSPKFSDDTKSLAASVLSQSDKDR